MTDNKDSLFDSAYFKPIDLANKMLDISSDKDKYEEIIMSLIEDYLKRFKTDIFMDKFINSVNN